MKPLQELIDQAAVRVAPPKAGESREARVLVRISDAKIDDLYKKLGIVFDRAAIPDHDAFIIKREVCLVLDAFFGRRRR